MGPLGDWVLREACRQVSAWAEQGARLDGRLAINVSAVQMEDPDIVGRLLEIVHEAGLDPERFELELTESTMMADPFLRSAIRADTSAIVSEADAVTAGVLMTSATVRVVAGVGMGPSLPRRLLSGHRASGVRSAGAAGRSRPGRSSSPACDRPGLTGAPRAG